MKTVKMKVVQKLCSGSCRKIIPGIVLLLIALVYGCWSSDGSSTDGPLRNPYLASSLYGITHFDSSQSDSTPYGPPAGIYRVDPVKQPIVYGGPVNIMTLASTDSDYMWSIGTDHVAYVDRPSGGWTTMARLDAPDYAAPGLDSILPETHQTFGELVAQGMTADEMNQILTEYYGANYPYRLLNGAYSLVDRDNVVYTNFGKGIYAFRLKDAADPAGGIEIVSAIEDVGNLQGGTPPAGLRLFGLTMTYDGFIIINYSNGIAVIGRDFNTATAQFYPFGEDEAVSNSLSVDEKNGIYIATDKLMRKLVWTGSRISDLESDGAWSSPYDAPSDASPPVIKFGLGTGSTPTLMGFGNEPDKLVVITDGAKQMNIVAFWRNDIPADFTQRPGTISRRIAGQIQVTCGFSPLPDWIQSEQSVAVNGYGAFVVNNIPADCEKTDLAGKNKLLTAALMGPGYGTCYGIERFRWDTGSRAWVSVWARSDVSSTSMVPVHSQSSGMALVSGYTNERGWEVTGLDWDTGDTVHQTLFGWQNYGNGAYALLEYLEDGDLIFNSIVGPFRVHYGN